MAPVDRRSFLRAGVLGAGGAFVGGWTLRDVFLDPGKGRFTAGFRSDAPAQLGRYSREADHYETHGDTVRCMLCPHSCLLEEGDRGFCRVRVVKGRRLHTIAYGNACAVHIDPIEKKPFYHFLPQTLIFSLATAGCNLRCLNCQNWEISQAKPEETAASDLMPDRIVEVATAQAIPSVAYTYSEPLIFYEYVKDTALRARARGVRNALVTAGFINPGPLRELLKTIDAVTLDLKAFSNHFYKRISGARLDPVLETIRVIRQEGVWLEVSNLVVPGLSDDPDDVHAFCRWLVEEIGPDQPLHFLRFHPDYRLRHLPSTPVATLEVCREAARAAGLRYVYLGNVPGHEAQNTYCPRDGRLLVQREGYRSDLRGLADGRCVCGERIPGVWA